jgi:hypothetical protein
VEVWFEGRWVCLEGFILDAQYLRSLQRRFPGARRFCGFGAATRDLSAPDIEWRGQDTFIQKEGIVDDFGIFDDPDAFYALARRQPAWSEAVAVRARDPPLDEQQRGARPRRTVVMSFTPPLGLACPAVNPVAATL